MVNIPIVEDRFAIRASGYYTDKGGYIDNILTGETDLNDATSKGVRDQSCIRDYFRFCDRGQPPPGLRSEFHAGY